MRVCIQFFFLAKVVYKALYSLRFTKSLPSSVFSIGLFNFWWFFRFWGQKSLIFVEGPRDFVDYSFILWLESWAVFSFVGFVVPWFKLGLPGKFVKKYNCGTESYWVNLLETIWITFPVLFNLIVLERGLGFLAFRLNSSDKGQWSRNRWGNLKRTSSDAKQRIRKTYLLRMRGNHASQWIPRRWKQPMGFSLFL